MAGLTLSLTSIEQEFGLPTQGTIIQRLVELERFFEIQTSETQSTFQARLAHVHDEMASLI